MSLPFQIDNLDLHAIKRTVIRSALGAIITVAPLILDPNVHYNLFHHDVTALVFVLTTGLVRVVEQYLTKE